MSIEKLRKAAADYIEARPIKVPHAEFMAAQERFHAALTPERVLALTKGAHIAELVNDAPTVASQGRWESLQRKAAEAVSDIEAAFGETDD